MQKFFSFVVLVLLLAGCKGPVTNYTNGLFSTDSLQTQNYTIDINADTLLATAGGAWLKIEKGTFSAAGNKVTLEIKEAYSIEQIIKAGLTTQSNGQPLSSGGMIYINAAAGQKVTVNKAFKVALPSSFLDKDMQLYKGEKNAAGNINWTNPSTVDTNSQLTAIQKGAVLFQQKCSSCHGIGKEGSGPDLANVVDRLRVFEGEAGYRAYHKFLRQIPSYSVRSTYSGKTLISADTTVFYHTDPYVCNLISLFNEKEVDLSADCEKNQDEWENIYRYIQNESDQRQLPNPRHAYLDDCIDSCRLYDILKNDLEEKKIKELNKKKGLIEDNGPLVDKRPDPTWQQNPNLPPPDFSNKVRPNEYNAVYYQFTIESFGWYNIDMLLNKKEGVQQSELFVRIRGAYKEKIKVYLIIPSAKVYGEGGPAERGEKDEYAFFEKKGTIPLPQNAKAYILAVTETENSVAYGLKEFVTQTKQNFELELQPASKAEFDKAIQSMDADKLKITVSESKHAGEIKAAEKNIKQLEEELKKVENLKPKNCDCDCGKAVDSVNTVPVETVLVSKRTADY